MRVELRADGLHLMGYVNVPGRMSRPVMTPRGKVLEIIEQRAFGRALDRAEKVEVLLDHNRERVLASKQEGNLTLEEDNVGLRAETIITDEEVIGYAKAGKIKGWSFNMKNVIDSIEERANGYPIRHVTDFDMSEISLVVKKTPCYSSTSIEIRAGEETEDVEQRSMDDGQMELVTEKKNPNQSYLERLEELRKVKHD